MSTGWVDGGVLQLVLINSVVWSPLIGLDVSPAFNPVGKDGKEGVGPAVFHLNNGKK